MNRLNLQRVLLFIGVMAIIGVLLYRGETQREKHKQEQTDQQEAKVAEQEAKVAEEKRKLEEESAAKQRQVAKEAAEQQHQLRMATEHKQFVNQYVNTNFTRTPGRPLVAVMAADETKRMNHALSAALITRFKGEPAQLVDSFFKPPLVTDDLFNDVFNGSTALFNKLEITNSVDALLLARQSVEYSINAELNNVITANMRVEIVTLPVAGQVESQGWSLIANGAGFRRPEARMQAEERIIKQIMDKPDMKLGLIQPNN